MGEGLFSVYVRANDILDDTINASKDLGLAFGSDIAKIKGITETIEFFSDITDVMRRKGYL